SLSRTSPVKAGAPVMRAKILYSLARQRHAQPLPLRLVAWQPEPQPGRLVLEDARPDLRARPPFLRQRAIAGLIKPEQRRAADELPTCIPGELIKAPSVAGQPDARLVRPATVQQGAASDFYGHARDRPRPHYACEHGDIGFAAQRKAES